LQFPGGGARSRVGEHQQAGRESLSLTLASTTSTIKTVVMMTMITIIIIIIIQTCSSRNKALHVYPCTGFVQTPVRLPLLLKKVFRSFLQNFEANV
jgi:ABC-type antimicrobial peptide transport system permease subunit